MCVVFNVVHASKIVYSCILRADCWHGFPLIFFYLLSLPVLLLLVLRLFLRLLLLDLQRHMSEIISMSPVFSSTRTL